MSRRRTLYLTLTVAAVVAVACAQEDPTVHPAVQVAPGQAPVTTAPATATSDVLGPTATTAPTTTTAALVSDAAKEPPLPDGAQHGDPPEVAARFSGIDGTADCDALAAERAADQADQAQMLATRSVGDHRAHAELDGRYDEQARHQMNARGCNQIAHTE